MHAISIVVQKIGMINKTIAIETTKLFLMAIGAVASIAFLAALQFWVAILGVAFAIFFWFIIYAMLENLSATAHTSEMLRKLSDTSNLPTAGSGTAADLGGVK